MHCRLKEMSPLKAHSYFLFALRQIRSHTYIHTTIVDIYMDTFHTCTLQSMMVTLNSSNRKKKQFFVIFDWTQVKKWKKYITTCVTPSHQQCQGCCNKHYILMMYETSGWCTGVANRPCGDKSWGCTCTSVDYVCRTGLVMKCTWADMRTCKIWIGL